MRSMSLGTLTSSLPPLPSAATPPAHMICLVIKETIVVDSEECYVNKNEFVP